MDLITITNLELETRIGVPDEERATPQRIVVSMEITTDTRETAATDNIEAAIDYEAVANDIRTLAETQRKTLERFAEDIADMILAKYGAKIVKVDATKFVLPHTDGVSVSITRP